MKDIEFEKFMKQAVNMCEDYSTVSPESDQVELFWFTPIQLRKYTDYCLNARRPKNTENQEFKNDN